MKAAVHFVGFRDDRFWAAVRVWGRPDFVHPDWDRWAAQEVAPGDLVVVAEGEADRLPRTRYRLSEPIVAVAGPITGRIGSPTTDRVDATIHNRAPVRRT